MSAEPLGVILAGGRSRRMGGGDKSLLPLGEGTILAQVVARLRPQVAGLALNANGDPARFAAFGLPVLPDSVAGFAGPLAGVLAGLDWAAAEGAEAIVTAAADTPFLPEDLVERLLSAAGKGALDAAPPPRHGSHPPTPPRRGGGAAALALAAAPAGKRHPTFGLWPVALRDDLRAALAGGTRKIVEWTDRHGAATAVFPDADAFFNVNTPDDLARAEAMLR